MDHAAKAAFVAKQTKMLLDHIEKTEVPHMAGGGVPGASGILGPVNQALGLQNQFSAGEANTQNGTNQGQLSSAYGATQGAQTGLNDLVNQTLPGSQQGTNAQINLSNQLAAEAQGQGPNPAQAALNQNTGQNVATEAALLAGQRGAAANPGLAAEQIAQQGAATQQQAIGQSATLQAQQQLAAQQNLANLSSNQVSQGLQGVQAQSSSTQNEQNILQGANSAYNNSATSMQGNINSTNAGVSQGNQNILGSTIGGIFSGASSAVGALFAKGGLVRMDKGGNVLDAKHRAALPKDAFALPGRRYPIHDENHARNALARVSQYGTSSEKAKVRAAVSKKYPNIGVKKMAEGGGVDPYHSHNNDHNQGAKQQAATASQQGGTPSDSPLTTRDWSHIWKACGGAVAPREGFAKMMAAGGYTGFTAPANLGTGINAPQSFAGQFLNSSVNVGSGPGMSGYTPPSMASASPGLGTAIGSGVGALIGTKSTHSNISDEQQEEDTLDADAQLGVNNPEIIDSGFGTGDMALVAKGGNVKAKNKSQEAKVPGDSLENDKIPTMLSQGEVVIDRNTLADKGPIGQMARAVAKHIEQRNKKQKAS